MRGNVLLCILILTTTLVLALPTTWATPFTVTLDLTPAILDLTALTGTDIQLELDLFDNDFILGNSHVLIDNVSIRDSSGGIVGPGLLDFEAATLDGFDASLNPGSVSNVAGAFPGDPGTRQLRLDEGLLTPTIAFRDFPFIGTGATQLRFDFEFFTPSGSPDTFVASLLDSGTLDPLLQAGVLGPGDAAFLEATSTANLLAPGVTATIIPEPTSLLLVAFGLLGFFGLRLRNSRRAK